jgi:hypothetical protein
MRAGGHRYDRCAARAASRRLSERRRVLREERTRRPGRGSLQDEAKRGRGLLGDSRGHGARRQLRSRGGLPHQGERRRRLHGARLQRRFTRARTAQTSRADRRREERARNGRAFAGRAQARPSGRLRRRIAGVETVIPARRGLERRRGPAGLGDRREPFGRRLEEREALPHRGRSPRLPGPARSPRDPNPTDGDRRRRGHCRGPAWRNVAAAREQVAAGQPVRRRRRRDRSRRQACVPSSPGLADRRPANGLQERREA